MKFCWVLFTKHGCFMAEIQSLHHDKIGFGHKCPLWTYNPTYFLPSSKVVKFSLKSLKMVWFSIFQLWHLKTLIFSSWYHFGWFSWLFRSFFWKKGKKFKLQLFWMIFGKTALCAAKWPSETNGMGQMACLGLGFHLKTWTSFFGKVLRIL